MSKKPLEIVEEMIKLAKAQEDPTGLKEILDKTLASLKGAQKEALNKAEALEKAIPAMGAPQMKMAKPPMPKAAAPAMPKPPGPKMPMAKDEKDKVIAHEVLDHKKPLPKAIEQAPHPKEMFRELRHDKAPMAKDEKGSSNSIVNSKGIHKPVSDTTLKELKRPGSLGAHTGRSYMGEAARSRSSAAKSHSVLNELKSMPKPNLPKSEDMAKDEKGVHPIASGGQKYKGQSPSGKHLRGGLGEKDYLKNAQEDVKPLHNKVIKELKSMPKPNLPKSEDMAKDELNSEMAHNDVNNIAEKANYLHSLMHELGTSKEAPAWMIEKLGQAKAHFQDVMDYVKGKDDPMKKGEKCEKCEKPLEKCSCEKDMKKAEKCPKCGKMGHSLEKCWMGKSELNKGVDPQSHLPGVLIQKDEEKAMKKMELCKRLKKCWDMKKAQANPDEKADAELGEEIEGKVEQHLMDNLAQEKKEGHHPLLDKIPEKEMEKAEILNKPYRSEAQRKWAHTPSGKKALGGEAKVKEWDKESKGMKLPEKAGKK